MMLKQYTNVGTIKKEVCIEFENDYSLTLEAGKEISLSVVEAQDNKPELLPNELYNSGLIDKVKKLSEKEDKEALNTDYIKNKLKEIFINLSDIDELKAEEIDEVIESSVAEQGGWEQFYIAIKQGIAKGYSVDKQLEIYAKLLKALLDHE